VTDILGIIMLFLLYFPFVKAIAQHAIDNSQLNIKSIAVQNPANDSFQFQMVGEVKLAGFISATIQFTEPVNVYWDNGGNSTQLGLISQFDDIKASHGHAGIDSPAFFQITDEELFGQFTSYMITAPSFTWQLQSENLKVRALKFLVASGIHFNKTINLTGIENFGGNVQLVSFALPQDDPAGGITFNAITALENNSPFQVDLGTAIFNLSYDGVFLGQGTSSATKLKPGYNAISLTGRLIPRNGSQTELATLGEFYTNFINGKESPVIAAGVSTNQPDGQVNSWLSRGLQSLSLKVPLKLPSALNPIQVSSIGYFNFTFSEDAPYKPFATRKDIPLNPLAIVSRTPTQSISHNLVDVSGFEIYTVQITNPTENSFDMQLAGSISNVSTFDVDISFPEGLKISWNGSPFGTFNMCDIYVVGNGSTKFDKTGTFQVADVNCLTDFMKTLLTSECIEMTITGSNLSVTSSGLTLPGISLGPMNVTLKAFDELKNNVKIESFDLPSDDPAGGIHLSLNATVINPSQVGIVLGSQTNIGSTVSFAACYQDVYLGPLVGGSPFPAVDNTTALQLEGRIMPQSGNNLNTVGQLFSNILAGNDSTLQVKGVSVDPCGNCSEVSWLSKAFQSLSLNLTLPGKGNLSVR
jgi:Protein of unknown function (DUF3712)